VSPRRPAAPDPPTSTGCRSPSPRIRRCPGKMADGSGDDLREPRCVSTRKPASVIPDLVEPIPRGPLAQRSASALRRSPLWTDRRRWPVNPLRTFPCASAARRGMNARATRARRCGWDRLARVEPAPLRSSRCSHGSGGRGRSRSGSQPTSSPLASEAGADGDHGERTAAPPGGITALLARRSPEVCRMIAGSSGPVGAAGKSVALFVSAARPGRHQVHLARRRSRRGLRTSSSSR
jgi:hypothetical protein